MSLDDQRPVPAADELTVTYWNAAADEQLVAMCCRCCGSLRHPPQPSCATCGAAGHDWRQLCGRGTLYSYVVNHQPLVPGFSDPYVIALVRLDEGLLMIGNLVDAGADIHLDAPVTVTFEHRVEVGVTLPQFRLARIAGPHGRLP